MTTKEQTLLLRLVAMVLAGIVVLAWATQDAHADTGFLVDEYVKGSSRFCVYDVMGEEYIITIDYADLCDMTIEV